MNGTTRTSDPVTSFEAADSVDASALEAKCLEAIMQTGRVGMTSEELATFTGMPLVTVSPRLRPLANKGLLVCYGKRANRSGRSAIVWVAA